MSTPTPGRVVAALAIVYVVWGSTYLAIKVGLEGFTPFLLGGTRFAFAGLLMLVWAAIRHRRATGRRFRVRGRELRSAAIAGGALLVGGNGAVTVAEQHIDSSLAALLVASVPLWMALFDRVRFAQRLPRPAVAGLVLGFAGVALLVRPQGAGAVGAALLVVAGAAVWAAGSLYSRGADLPSDPIASTALQMLSGSAMFFALAVVNGEPARADLGAISVQSALAVAYLVVFGSVVAFTAYTWLLRNVASSTVATYAYVNPVVAVVLGVVVLGERLTPSTVVAAGLVVGAVALIVGSRRGDRPRTDEVPVDPEPDSGPTPRGEVAPTAA